MNPSDELSSLFAAERAEQPPAAHASQGWEQLQGALQADLPALAIAHGPLKLGLSLATKSILGTGQVASAASPPSSATAARRARADAATRRGGGHLECPKGAAGRSNAAGFARRRSAARAEQADSGCCSRRAAE